MNNVSVESFINFCDDMIIAEEGFASGIIGRKLFNNKKNKQKITKNNNHHKPITSYDLPELTEEDKVKIEHRKALLKKYLPLIEKEFKSTRGVGIYDMEYICEYNDDFEFLDQEITIGIFDLWEMNGNYPEDKLDESVQWTREIERIIKKINSKYKDFKVEDDWDKLEGNLYISFNDGNTATESFVDFCDSMIAEEGLLDRFKKKKKDTKSVELTEEQLKERKAKLAKYIPIVKREFSKIKGVVIDTSKINNDSYKNNDYYIGYTNKYPNGNCPEDKTDEAEDWVNSVVETCETINSKYKEFKVDDIWDMFEGYIFMTLK